jgi:hypothetical protein
MNIEEIREQAQNENTAPEILAESAQNEDTLIRKYVASNPNTPVEALQNLGKEFPDEIITNPIFYLLFLENSASYFVRLSLARYSNTSEETLSKLADLTQITIKEIDLIYAIAKHLNTPIITLEKLLDWHPNFSVNDGSDFSYWRIPNNIAYLIANNPKTPSYLLKQIAYERSQYMSRRASHFFQ